MRRIILAIPASLACVWALQAAAPRPDVAQDAPRAADSLKRSADHMIVMRNAPLRAARLVALSRFALRLVPDDPRTHRTFADVIYPSQGQGPQARKALEAYLVGTPDDHMAAVRWLVLASSAEQTAEARVTLLASVANDESKPAALRSEAAARLGQLRVGRGERDDAAKAFAGALVLDPGNAIALAGRLDLLPQVTPQERVRTLLADLEATAGGAATASELADVLQAVGLHREAVVLYEYLLALASLPGSTSQDRQRATVRFCNALLDARQALKIIEILPPMLRIFRTSIDLRSLLAEAWRATYNDTKAKEQIAAIEVIYKSARDTGRVSTAMAGELAMFYLVARPDAERALQYARQVAAQAPSDSTFARRVLGAAELASGKTDLVAAGRKRLESILDRDLYAAALLARHHFAAADRDAAVAAVRAGMKLPRGGPAWRQLVALAEKHTVNVPLVAGSTQIAALMARLRPQSLQMRRTPGKFIRVTITAATGSAPGPVRLAPGDVPAARLTIENISKVPIPIGRRGLIEPLASLEVAVDGAGDQKHFSDLPRCLWPAPRYLQPAQKLQDVVRLDVGTLGLLLAETPLTELTLTVTPVVSPVEPFGRVISALLPLKIEPLKIVRADLLGSFDRKTPAEWPARYQRALGLIVRDMKQGDTERRMRAARQVASLLALARRIERRAAAAPEPLKDAFTKPVLLTMLREVMKDASYAVRAEMIAAMDDVPIDRHIMALLAPAAQDPHPLVRFRLAEIVVTASPTSARDILAVLARDTDPLVRLMANPFATRPPRARQ